MKNINKKIMAIMMTVFMIIAAFGTLSVSATNSEGSGSEQCYGFIIPVSDDQSVNLQNSISKLVNELLGKNVDVYWIASDLSVSSEGLGENDVVGDITFNKGSFVVPFSGISSIDLEITVTMYHYRYDIVSSVAIYKVMDSLSITVYKLVEPKIAYHAGEGVDPWKYYSCLQDGGFPKGEFLDWNEITPTRLSEFNVFIWGGTYGDYNFNEFNKWNSAVDSVKNFIKNGGGYVGSCLGGYVASNGIGAPLDSLSSLLDRYFPDYFIGGIDCETFPALPGIGTVKTKIVNPDNPVAFGVKEFTEQYLSEGPVFTLLGPNTKSLANYYDVVDDEDDEFWWHENIPEGTRAIWTSYTLGKPSAVTSQLEDGKVVAFGTHPEGDYGTYPERDYKNARFVYNAVFYVTSQEPTSINIQRSITFQNMDLDAGGPYDVNLSESISFHGSVSSEYQPSCWFWNFGDGETSTNQNPTHVYNSPQGYAVLLFAADNNNIDVNVTTADIHGDLEVSIPGGYYNTTIQDSPDYHATVSGGFSPYSYHWNMGDGTIKTEESFDYSHNEVGIYDASVTVTDKLGTSDTCYFKIIVNDMNTPFEITNFQVDPYCTAIGVAITFSALIDVIDYSRDLCTCHRKLDFDDGSYNEKTSDIRRGEAERLEWLHSYSNLGKYYPILTVTDDYGRMYFAITGVNINNLGPPAKPATPSGPTSVEIEYDDISGYGEYSVTTTDPDEDQIKYEWDTDNDYRTDDYWYESGETCTTRLYWYEEGIYNLTVRAIDEYGHKSEWSDPLIVTVTKKEDDNIKDDDNEHGPLAKLTTSSNIITRGNTRITFDASGSKPKGIAPIRWIRWDFDDDEEWDTIWRLFAFNKKKTKNFNYLFNRDNTDITEFNVKVEIKDILGRTDTATKKITVDYSDDEQQQMMIKFKKGIRNVPPAKVYEGETFTVIVKGPSGVLPIAGAEVAFDGETKHTNIFGRVKFTANNAGTDIRVTAEKEGYRDTSSNITIYSEDDEDSDSSCFLKDTKIAMADDSLKNIQDIEIGDMVQSYDTADDEWKTGIVSEVFHHSPEEMVDHYLILNDDLCVTPNHPVFLDGSWIDAGELKVGDTFYGGINSIEKVYSRVPTFNFEVLPYHNYQVIGSSSGLVHNVDTGHIADGGTTVSTKTRYGDGNDETEAVIDNNVFRESNSEIIGADYTKQASSGSAPVSELFIETPAMNILQRGLSSSSLSSDGNNPNPRTVSPTATPIPPSIPPKAPESPATPVTPDPARIISLPPVTHEPDTMEPTTTTKTSVIDPTPVIDKFEKKFISIIVEPKEPVTTVDPAPMIPKESIDPMIPEKLVDSKPISTDTDSTKKDILPTDAVADSKTTVVPSISPPSSTIIRSILPGLSR